MKVFYSPDYVGAGYAFDTTRKAKWVADSLLSAPLAGLELVSPSPLTEADVCQVHSAAYVQAVRTGAPLALAQSQSFTWDAGLWPMVLASNGGAVAAAHEALRSGVAGSLSSGLHHAAQAQGRGYCTFNGLVLAAQSVLAAGAQRVLIVDLDAHCGGGTASLIQDDARIWQLDVSVDDYDAYAPGPRTWLSLVTNSNHYLAQVHAGLQWVDALGLHFDLCLYNAGMDPFERCPDGALAGIDQAMLAQREQIMFDWCRARRLPVAFMLAGGYIGPQLSQDELVSLHRLTLSAALGA